MSMKAAEVCVKHNTDGSEQTSWLTVDVNEQRIRDCHGDKQKIFTLLTEIVHAEYPEYGDATVFQWKGMHGY
jgi:hypothetical protein